MTYEEYINELNDEAIYRGLSNMTEVESIKTAQKTGEELIKLINKTSNLTKKQIKEAKHAIAEITFHNTKYVAALYCLNGTNILLRATDPINKKYYIPNDIWIATTNPETDETELRLMMSIGEQVE